MAKLVSFIVFLAAFVWTWFLFNSKPLVNVGVHAGLQSKLALMIEETVKTHKPNSFDFKMQSIYTKTLDANKVAAYYKYNFSEKLEGTEVSIQTIDGEAILNRTLSENPDDQKWVVQSVKSENPVVEFQEGVIIASGDTAAEAAAPQKQGSENAAPAATAVSGDATPAAPSETPTANSTPAPAQPGETKSTQ